MAKVLSDEGFLQGEGGAVSGQEHALGSVSRIDQPKSRLTGKPRPLAPAPSPGCGAGLGIAVRAPLCGHLPPSARSRDMDPSRAIQQEISSLKGIGTVEGWLVGIVQEERPTVQVWGPWCGLGPFGTV
ncbi:hypothetical protein TREES_T100016040 [Tupaia chinensis]|uniref:Uncharacterized protein n=1 Tax=Tupaia chinensis TaxID=246437 RepID=L9KKV8_TUPCH|nr:hypothetical protein TREES_T100016040 [Tupaia chinensis]